MDIESIESSLKNTIGDVSVKQTHGLSGGELIIQADYSVDASSILSAVSELGIDVENYSSQTIGPALGASFWSQAQLAIIFAFIMMGIIVFLIFRTPVPSGAVILAALSDILVTLAALQFFGIDLSLAGLAALLMLIGYSVDTDIMLTTRMLKGTEEYKTRLHDALKTGLTMSLTTIGALLALLFTGLSPVLSQIALVLLIGLIADICFTWMQNATILRWYMEKRGLI